jgi:hypothetical protein
MGGGDLDETLQRSIKAAIDRVADAVASGLRALGLPGYASILFRPFNLIVALDAEKVVAVFSPSRGGLPSLIWLDRSAAPLSAEALTHLAAQQLGHEPELTISLPRAVLEGETAGIAEAAMRHLRDVERAASLSRVPDAAQFPHLERAVRSFLEDHPDPAHNVFIMMRFLESDQFEEIHQTIRAALTEANLHPVRADDRDYTRELWSNVEVCMLCCQLGVAVFEDIEERSFNPNVALELGWMMARQRRCLILKERHLPTPPCGHHRSLVQTLRCVRYR